MADPTTEVEEGNRRFRHTEEKVERRDPQYGLDPAKIKRVWSEGGRIHYSIGGNEMLQEEYLTKASGK